jgi:hypothetical protein
MIDNVYKVEGKYPDPYEIESKLEEMAKDPNRELEYAESLDEVIESGLKSHPLLNRFFR